MARRRKEEGRTGIPSRGIGRRLDRFSSRVRHQVVPDRGGSDIQVMLAGNGDSATH